MKLFNIIERATDFGTFRSRDNFFSFGLKILFYILPAVIFGHYTDLYIKTLKKHNVFGNTILFYILLQTLLIIASLYILIIFLKDYMSELQETAAGGYFIVLYFGIQTNYIYMLEEYIHSLTVNKNN
jgi:hypothetical protein